MGQNGLIEFLHAVTADLLKDYLPSSWKCINGGSFCTPSEQCDRAGDGVDGEENKPKWKKDLQESGSDEHLLRSKVE